MSQRLQKKNLQRKIFHVMHSLHQCFSHFSCEFAQTPIAPIKAKSYWVADNRLGGVCELFRPAEPWGKIEAKARQFIRDVQSHHSEDDFNRALHVCNADFDHCETGCVEAITFYLRRIDRLRAK